MKTMKSKQKSSKSVTFAKGGSGKMFGKQSAGTQKPAQTAQAGKGGGKFAKGGSGKMFGKQSTGKQKPGQTAQTRGRY
jgi:hypothetical protein